MTKVHTIPRTALHTIIRKEVVDVVTELLSDPDAGLELNRAFERRLKRSTAEKAKGRTRFLSEVFAQYRM
ncbi:MAG: hypothetical protein A3D64_02495 [Candidatus Wildermuthbacteria bacterium RIFCSPHIGHO2_02_FULL_49_9]|uniref:Uncharacterized protein n=3 Tax=Parcubacteria group TaxID=1794811 RepID=A0A1F8DSE2_9BACT|nr:MAG: hypothetical protein A2755_03045 [Candidatus Wolfebacteria bacterium RIFCSPHIGHO2_01_FULL_48_22]OGM92567.1 MAG: hypothetical protein A2935_01420 [Candidatus Wolfebacteria bacterium RIFCSPLOWO2_01_FULL_47_17b]OHA70120.1 MAG: hypothetical protein A3D64_02495 [Candidatus Wildermuthbacteria bacterium RIFCSPHIGHO2_02_FULL_49_9]